MSDSAKREWRFHGYLGIDDDTLWSIVRGDAPALLPRLIALKGAVS
jgi:uncharacterized protein with HEPN domain